MYCLLSQKDDPGWFQFYSTPLKTNMTIGLSTMNEDVMLVFSGGGGVNLFGVFFWLASWSSSSQDLF